MFLLTDIEDDNRAATTKEIDFLNELKLLWLQRTEDKNTSKQMTDSDESEKEKVRFGSR